MTSISEGHQSSDAVRLPNAVRIRHATNPVAIATTLALGAAIGLLIAEPTAMLVIGILVAALTVTVMSWYL
jgi:uncharacterized membrane protein